MPWTQGGGDAEVVVLVQQMARNYENKSASQAQMNGWSAAIVRSKSRPSVAFKANKAGSLGKDG